MDFLLNNIKNDFDIDYITEYWITRDRVKTKLLNYNLEPQMFKNHFAKRVVEYFSDIINGKCNIGQCPAITIMLIFFKDKNIPIKDIYSICNGFIESVVAYFLKKDNLNESVLNEIFTVISSNFEGVIEEFFKLEEEKKINISTLYNEKVCKIEDKIVLSDNNTVKKNKQIFIDYIEEEDLLVLRDLEDDIDDLIHQIDTDLSLRGSIQLNDINDVMIFLNKYGNVLISYILFEELGNAIVNFAHATEQLKKINEKETKEKDKIKIFLYAFIDDIKKWKKLLFFEGIENANELDASIISNIEQIKMLLEDKKEIEKEEDDDDMGDIFDF